MNAVQNTTLSLPPPGRWAIGHEARRTGEQLLAQARTQGLRTAWLGAEAGFLSNLSVLENLRLMHDWHAGDPLSFERDLLAALTVMALDIPDWLQMRPSQLLDTQLIRARLLRVLLLRPDAVVLSPVTLGLAGDVLSERLLQCFDEARVFLLDHAQPGWPAWPAHDILAASSMGSSA